MVYSDLAYARLLDLPFNSRSIDITLLITFIICTGFFQSTAEFGCRFATKVGLLIEH